MRNNPQADALGVPPTDWNVWKELGFSSPRQGASGNCYDKNSSMVLLWNQIRWRGTSMNKLSPLQKSLKILMDTAVRSRSERVVCVWNSRTLHDDDNNAEYSLFAPLLLAQDDNVIVVDSSTGNGSSTSLGIKVGHRSSSNARVVNIARLETRDGVTVAEVRFPYLSLAAQQPAQFETALFDLGDYPNMERSLPLFHPSWSPDTGVVIFMGSLQFATMVAAVGYCDLHSICITGLLHNPAYDLLLNVSIQALDGASDWILEQQQKNTTTGGGDDHDDWLRQGKKTLEMRKDVSEGIWDLYMNYNTRDVLYALMFLIVATVGAWRIETGAFHFLFALVAVDQLREECGLYRVIVHRRLRPFPKSGARSGSSRRGISGNPVLKLGGVEPFSHTMLVVSLGIVEACYEIAEDGSLWPLQYTLAVGVFWGVIWILDLIWMVNIVPDKKWKLGEIGIDLGPDDPKQSFDAILGSNAIALSRVKVGSSRYVDSEEDSAAWLTACKNPEVARRLHKSSWGCFVRGSNDLSAGVGERWILCGSMPSSTK